MRITISRSQLIDKINKLRRAIETPALSSNKHRKAENNVDRMANELGKLTRDLLKAFSICSTELEKMQTLELIATILNENIPLLARHVRNWAKTKRLRTMPEGHVALLGISAAKTMKISPNRNPHWWYQAVSSKKWLEEFLGSIERNIGKTPEFEQLATYVISNSAFVKNPNAAEAMRLRLKSYEARWSLAGKYIEDQRIHTTIATALIILGHAAAMPSASVAIKAQFYDTLEFADRLIREGGTINGERAFNITSRLLLGTKRVSKSGKESRAIESVMRGAYERLRKREIRSVVGQSRQIRKDTTTNATGIDFSQS